MVRLLVERSATKSNVKFAGFLSQLQASNVSSHTEELWCNEKVSLWMIIYMYIYIHIYSDYHFFAEEVHLLDSQKALVQMHGIPQPKSILATTIACIKKN